MKKKVTQRLKGSSAKSNNSKKIAAQKPKAAVSATKTQPKPQAKPDPRFTQAVQNYEAALKLMQSQKFDRAKAALEKVLAGPSTELADRARMHIRICDQQMAKTSTSFKTPEEQYDYAISLMNGGDYDEARSQLGKLVKTHPKADYGFYGLALLDCLTGQVEDALRNLQQSIRLNPGNRFQARNDTDFGAMADDPRFTELLYPEPDSSKESSTNSR
jgi:tetratricopeptide (TPR) repeat protein